ncbi:nuclear transport factor 2 (NTF2) domain plus RRM domain [Cryptosporidium sp. chipmunk genotype I]|uniref:nuclear transport factor 2 (NTF2) domain plus RRM domain n=1 Tax=Cryptosporidium sp. chipmunk genotype I TaxID=1280935 RepID=UPI00351A34E1|nr:nuclear transport factor 2 (NTF2) domain plus RRM domain [Cryptosporidium sp. chipmunk genotype I]
MTEGTSNNSACNASKIADFFVTEFYSRLKKDPSTLYELYHDSGYLTWVGNRSETIDCSPNSQSVIRAETKEKIRSAINLLDLNNCTTYVEVLECSKSINNSLCITAKGRMYIGEGESVGRSFVQNFLLTEIRPRWYFIRNDCLIFMDSELPLKQSVQATAKIANHESGVVKNSGKKSHDSSLETIKPQKEQNHSSRVHCADEHNKVDKHATVPKDDESKDPPMTTLGAHTNSDSHLESQKRASSSTTANTSNTGNNHANASASNTTTNNAAANTISASPPLPLDPANHADSLNAKNNANINRSSPHKYEVTSYAGKLMGGALKSGNKVKGYAIHVPTEDKNKTAPQNGSTKRPSTQKDPKSIKEAKNKRKIFVHSLPSNISDDQIREAVLNQLKVHGGGYVIDIERARVSGRHWGIIELDSEFSCKTLLNNGLYLGGMEISIEKWKQINQSQGHNFVQNSSKFNNKNSIRQTGNNYHHNSGSNTKH